MRWRQVFARGAAPGARPVLLGLLVALAFVVGVVSGSLAVNALSPADKSYLGQVLDASLALLAGDGAPSASSQVFYRSLLRNLGTAAVMWLAGFTVLGIPVIFGVLFFRGFLIGFSVGFMVYQRGWEGLALALAAVAVPNLLAVPALVFLGLTATAFAVHLHRQRSHGPRVFPGQEAAMYGALGGIACGALAISSALDGFVGVWLLRLLASGR